MSRFPKSARLGAACLALLFAMPGPFARPAQAQSQSIAAVVNEQIVTGHDVEERLKLVMTIANVPPGEEARRRLRPQVLRALIDERLQMQEAQRLNIAVTASEIQEAISQIERQNNLPVGGLDEYLRRNGLQLATLLDQLKANIAWSKVIRRQVRAKVEVGDEEIDEYLQRLRQRGSSTEYDAAEIFIPIEAGGEEAAAVTAQRVAEQARAGAPFPALARQFSQAPSAAAGGELGIVREGQLDERLEGVLARLEPGQISEPVRTETGFYILRLKDKKTTAGPRAEDTTVSLRRIFLALPPNAGPEEVRTQAELARRGHPERRSPPSGRARVGHAPRRRPNAYAGSAGDPAVPRHNRGRHPRPRRRQPARDAGFDPAGNRPRVRCARRLPLAGLGTRAAEIAPWTKHAGRIRAHPHCPRRRRRRAGPKAGSMVAGSAGADFRRHVADTLRDAIDLARATRVARNRALQGAGRLQRPDNAPGDARGLHCSGMGRSLAIVGRRWPDTGVISMEADYRCLFPFPDGSDSFVHGYEAGLLDARMTAADALIEGVYHTANLTVFRRMCGHFGYDIEARPTEYPEWTAVTFRKRRSRLTVVA